MDDLQPLEARQGQEGLDLRGLLATLWRGKRLMILSLLLGLTFAALYLWTTVPKFTAEAWVRFITESTSIADLESVVTGISSEEEALNTETMVLTSHALLGKVVDDLNLTSDPEFYTPPEEREEVEEVEAPPPPSPWRAVARFEESTPEREAAIEALGYALDIEVVDKTYVLSIQAETQHPEKSAAVANALAEYYVQGQLESKFEATRRATVWLSEQVAELKTALEDAESAVEDFISSSPLVSDLALQESAARLQSLRERRLDRLAQQESLTAQLADVRALREVDDFEGVAASVEDPRLTRLAQQIANAESDDTRQALVAQFDAALEVRQQAIEREVAAIERQVETLQQAIGEGEQNLDSRGSELIELRQLQREAEATRLLYEHFLSRMKETSVQQGVQQADAEVLAWARPPNGPSFPSKSGTVARATLLSLVLGAALVFLLEHMNRRFRTPQELEEITGAPVIAVLPTAPGGSPLDYVVERPGSVVAEAVRNLRTSVLLSNLDRPPQVIMMTSSLPAEGKSTTLLMLAQITAQMGKSALVIESDIRRPKFKPYLEQEKGGGLLAAFRGQKAHIEGDRPGLLTLLSGEAPVEDVVHSDPNTGLDIIFSQKSKVNAADLFSSERFSSFVNEMRERYDFIFLDTPPVLLVPDARIIAQVADVVLYAVRWNSTTREQVKSGLKMLAQAQVRVSGLALTRVDPRGIGRYGYEGYGSSYAASSEYYAN